MNAAVCKKEFDEIKGLISNGEISQSLDRLKVNKNYTKLYPTLISNSIVLE